MTARARLVYNPVRLTLLAVARAVDVLQGFDGKGKSTLRQRLTPA